MPVPVICISPTVSPAQNVWFAFAVGAAVGAIEAVTATLADVQVPLVAST